MTDQFKAFVAGGAGGAACVTVGFPFDTIKVKMQTAEAGLYKNMLDCVQQSVRKQGFLGLYQGPLLCWHNRPCLRFTFGDTM